MKLSSIFARHWNIARHLERLKETQNSFQDVDFAVTGHFNHPISVAAKIMLTKHGPIIGGDVVVDFVD